MKDPGHDINQIIIDFQDPVYNQAYRMLGNRSEAEDAAQEVFLKVHNSIGKFRGESKLSSWIWRITANVCVSRLRKKQWSESMDDPAFGSKAGGLSSESNPEKEVARKQIAEMIRNGVRNLPPLWAQAISLHYFAGRSYEEVSEAMGIPKGTVATYMSRGKIRLAESLMSRLGKAAVGALFGNESG